MVVDVGAGAMDPFSAKNVRPAPAAKGWLHMILCCGEALIDMLPRAHADGAQGFVPHAGGAIFNTAIALGRLGTPTGFLTGASTDLFGDILRAELEASGVATDLIVWSDRPTTLAFVKLTGGQAHYTFYDENTAGRMLDPQAAPTIPDDVTTLYFGGISLIGEPAADFYLALAEREAARRVIVCDPNIRAGFIRDEAAYRRRLDRMMAHTDILKVSDEDVSWLVPGAESVLDKARSLLAKGPRIVVLTRGAEGASAVTASGETVSVAVRKVTVVDTVGAGDTFNAGVLARLHGFGLLNRADLGRIEAEHLKAALEHGARVAAVTVSRPGANPPWAHEL